MSRFIYLMVVLAFASCSKNQMNEEDLREYIENEENGLHQVVLRNDITIEAFYKPSEMVWKNDIRNIVDPTQRDEYLRACDSLTYFSVHFSRKGKEIENAYVSDPILFNNIINYLSFEISNDFYLIAGKDTIPAIDAVYARTFGAATSTNVMVTFDVNIKNEVDGPVKLRFNDKMFNTGLSDFDFQSTDIKKTPSLILN